VVVACDEELARVRGVGEPDLSPGDEPIWVVSLEEVAPCQVCGFGDGGDFCLYKRLPKYILESVLAQGFADHAHCKKIGEMEVAEYIME
jgi:hypothetical protein